MKCWKRFCKRWRRPWKNKSKSKCKELYPIYGWVSPKVPVSQRCPYVYVFRIKPVSNGDAIPHGFERGRILRGFVHQNVLWKTQLGSGIDTVGSNLIHDWDQIIPSAARLPTHRLEMGILRKGSKIPRSPFFDEYFCFLPLYGGDSDKAAIRIAGFLTLRLKESKNFDGEALKLSKVYWLAAILVAWKRLS